MLCMLLSHFCSQVWELLKQRRYAPAIALAKSALGSPPSPSASGEHQWAGLALAQAGLLLLNSMRITEAIDALENCPLTAWQPAQLLPMFPESMVRWLGEAPPPKAYWGLHGPGPLQSKRGRQ